MNSKPEAPNPKPQTRNRQAGALTAEIAWYPGQTGPSSASALYAYFLWEERQVAQKYAYFFVETIAQICHFSSANLGAYVTGALTKP